ncbi:hypothetical protein C8J56DRAFT_1176433 [Mycena floridula]|nr:hypothetical protein C8J56DRAFT_1176433 [Mycena floridula]
MQGQEYRPFSPDSMLTSTLDHASSTIDDLTLALANFSRVPSPEPPGLSCCCGQECENLRAWQEMKARLESRLTLSAEVGQALLHRHEAYIRRHEVRRQNAFDEESIDDGYSTQDDADNRISELLAKNAALEKRLTQSVVNNEVTEVSNKTILQELQEAKTTISRLSAHQARSMGWDNRITQATKERDDMQQERDFESQRARVAESRFAALKEKTSKLQADVRRLQDELQEKRLHRLESSESILQDARQVLQGGSDQPEVTKVLESLVDDNEVLKRDNMELQRFLADSREDMRALQEELDEQRASRVSRPGANTPTTPSFRQHFYSGSMSSSAIKEHLINPTFGRRNSGARNLEPLNLGSETPHRPISPESLAPSESARNSISHPTPRYPTSPYAPEFHDDGEKHHPTHKPLFLLARTARSDRAIQTETHGALLSPSTVPSHTSSPSPNDPRSESSSFSESSASNMSILLERVAGLLNRMSQADALTLTNRLKRQHLKGADIGYLSRSTVGNIVNDVGALRTQFRALLEDDKAVTVCTRRDLRSLFKVLKDIFSEMGQMRVTLNQVILDPSVAPAVSELSLNPSKAEAESIATQEKDGSWMAPISKLFGAAPAPGITRSVSGRAIPRPPRFVPKLQPALSASATTVNVEFSGSGVGRAVTSTQVQAVSSPASHSNVMGIFAGAPAIPDSWVVLPKVPRRVQSSIRPTETANNRLSRNVDAIIDFANPPREDDEEADYLGPLIQRGLRRKNLSDSSIHSTFMEQEAPAPSPTDGQWSDRTSVLQSLSRKVQNFRLAASSPFSANETGAPPPVVSSGHRAKEKEREKEGKGLSALLSWSGAGVPIEPFAEPPYGSPGDESSMYQRTRLGAQDSAYTRDYY